MTDILTQLAPTSPWWLYATLLVAVVAPIALTTPQSIMPMALQANPVEGSNMATATRQTSEKKIPDPPATDVTGDLTALVSPDKTGAFLSEEDVDRITTELLRIASDLTYDLAHNGTAGRADALMRSDVSSRLTSVAAVLLDRARTTP